VMIKKNRIKKTLKPILRPFLGPGLKVLHLKLFNHHIFVNKYTRRIPVFNRTFEHIQSRMLFIESRKEREADYKKWFKKNFPREHELKKQCETAARLKQKPLISLIMPTYNTKPVHLRAAIESVIRQTYQNWELCMADDASTNQKVRDIIERYAAKDKRIKYVFRQDNGHICEASNSALKLASGKYIALLDHDDWLWPNALFEMVQCINRNPNAKLIYSDEEKIDEEGKKHSEPFFKPDWSPEFLRSINYITHFAVLDRKLVHEVGAFRKGYEGAQDWDLFLRISRETDQIYHVPKVIYSWRKTEASTANQPSAKDYAYVNQERALHDDISARGLKVELSWQIPFSMWRVDYKIDKSPLVSIIIPTKDQADVLRQCLSSIAEKTTYKNFETIIVDTGSVKEETWRLYDEYKQPLNLKIVKWDKPFNFSSVCNFGADHSSGEYLLFLNNDTEVITPNWIEDMLGYALQKDIGAVGCKLYYPDGKLQHGGIILGVGGQKGTPGIAGHFFPAFKEEPTQDPGQLLYDGGTRNFAAVTAACLMVSKAKFDKVNGFDTKFRIAFNDVDFCLELLKSGLRNVYLPHVQLYHHESISIGKPGAKQRDLEVFAKEIDMMLRKWRRLIVNDPYYHPEFRRDVASARLKV
jgi:GT2 family glycosyltransferase